MGIQYLPDPSVRVRHWEPMMTTSTPGRGRPVESARTVPVSTLCPASEEARRQTGAKAQRRKNAKKRLKAEG
jgi:hypothetical protein